MQAFVLSIIWTLPFAFFEWLGVPWYWALFLTLPVMAAVYVLYYRWVDRHG